MSKQYDLPLRIPEIQAILPHRYPFLFLDEVTEFEDAKRIVGKKNISFNEPFFQGHFPGRPILPGVIMLEALAQLGAIFAKMSTGGTPPDRLIVFSGADEVRFRRPVYPGDTLMMSLSEPKRKSRYWRMAGDMKVGEDLVMEAVIMATEVD